MPDGGWRPTNIDHDDAGAGRCRLGRALMERRGSLPTSTADFQSGRGSLGQEADPRQAAIIWHTGRKRCAVGGRKNATMARTVLMTMTSAKEVRHRGLRRAWSTRRGGRGRNSSFGTGDCAGTGARD